MTSSVDDHAASAYMAASANPSSLCTYIPIPSLVLRNASLMPDGIVGHQVWPPSRLPDRVPSIRGSGPHRPECSILDSHLNTPHGRHYLEGQPSDTWIYIKAIGRRACWVAAGVK